MKKRHDPRKPAAAPRSGVPQFGKADRPPTDAEEQAADRSRTTTGDGVADHYEEMMDRGAAQKGEGRIS